MTGIGCPTGQGSADHEGGTLVGSGVRYQDRSLTFSAFAVNSHRFLHPGQLRSSIKITAFGAVVKSNRRMQPTVPERVFSVDLLWSRRKMTLSHPLILHLICPTSRRGLARTDQTVFMKFQYLLEVEPGSAMRGPAY